MAIKQILVGKRGSTAALLTFVRGDSNTQIIRLVTQRYYGGVDLGGLAWSVVLENADGDTDTCYISETKVNDATIACKWKPRGLATSAVGLTKFQLEGFEEDEGGHRILVWQSGAYYFNVVEDISDTTSPEEDAALTGVQQLILYVDKSLAGVVQAGSDAATAAEDAGNAAQSANAATVSANAAASAANNAHQSAVTATGSANTAANAANTAAQKANTAANSANSAAAAASAGAAAAEEARANIQSDLNSLKERMPVAGTKPEKHYMLEQSDIDVTLSLPGKAAEAAVVGRKVELLSDGKVDRQQGKDNAEKLLYVDDSGAVVPLALGKGMQLEATPGKNIVHGEWVPGRYNSSTGQWDGMTSFNGNLAIQAYFPVEPGTTYTVSNTEASAAGASMYVYEFTKDLEFIQRLSDVKAFASVIPGRFATSADTAYITISAYAYDGALTTLEASRPINLMIEKGSTATAYEPYAARNALSVERYAEKVDRHQGADEADKLLYIDNAGDISPLALGNGIQLETEVGKNIVHGEWVPGRYNSSTGQWDGMTSFNGNLAIREYFPVEPETTYAVSNTAASSSGASMYVYEFTRDLEFIQRLSDVKAFASVTPGSFTTSANTAYITISAYAYDGALTTLEASRPINLMIEKGSSATAYEPYAAEKVLAIMRHEEKVDKNQGVENAEKLLYVDDSGAVVPLPLGNGIQLGGTPGKNIVYGEWVPGRYNSSTGEWDGMTSFNGNLAIQEYFPVESETTYTVSNTEASASGASMYVYEYAADFTFIQRLSGVKVFSSLEPGSFTTHPGAAYITISAYAYDGAATTLEASRPINLMIEKGSSATEYEPHTTPIALSVKRFNEMEEAVFGADVPGYYYQNLYLDGKCDRIRELAGACAGNGDLFAFVTDQHWTLNARHSPALIRYIAEKTYLPRVFCGGDTADKASEAYVRTMAKSFDGDIHYMAGNHDFFGGTTGHAAAMIFDMGKRDQIGNAQRHYYYVDNPQQKIRYIVLNPFDSNAPVDDSIVSAYEAEQVNWLRDVALQVESGWTVLVFTHCLYYGTEGSEALYPSPDGAEAVATALDAAACDVACVIQGHLHLDRITHTPGGIPVVTTTCDKHSPWIDGGTDQEPWLSNRVEGTITEQAFDVVVLDKNARKLTFVRIGAPADSWMDGISAGTVEERVVTY